MANTVTIELLNHAAIVVQSGETSLLCDPWFDGTCFRGGWGLHYLNPKALEKASRCSHLWISHFHSDHLHMPTLQRIAKCIPNICALANVSANFSMEKPLERAGFTKIRPLYERRPLSLKGDCQVTRFGTTSIDNMLVIRAGGLTILNLNDCNLPVRALRSLVSKIGNVDILLNNYNHAGKVIEYTSHELIREKSKRRFQIIVDAVKPRWVIPFASMHYYRSQASAYQNDSLLTVEDLVAVVQQTVPMAVGDRAVFAPGREVVVQRMTPPLAGALRDQKEHGASIPWEQLIAAAEVYRARLRRGFLGYVRWIAPLAIRVEDLNRVLLFDLANGISERESTYAPVHLSAHSETILDWLGTPFGASAFWVGADFAIRNGATRPIERLMLASLLLEHCLAPRDIVRMLMKPSGWGFLFHRREEILWTLLGFRFGAGDYSRS